MASWKLLSGWRKPRWQHPDPAVRRRALLELGAGHADAAEILSALVEDSAAEVREVAIKRIDDITAVRRALTDDPDASVRTAAAVRYRQLLISSLPADAAAAELACCPDTTVPGHVARRARAAEVRRAALVYVESHSVLVEAALHDDNPAVRREAVARIDDPATLQELIEQAAARDSHAPADITETARERLASLTDHSPLELCREMEELACGEWSDSVHARRREITARWRALTHTPPAEVAARFRRASTRCLLQRPPENTPISHLCRKLEELLSDRTGHTEEWTPRLESLSRGVLTLRGAHPDEARARILLQAGRRPVAESAGGADERAQRLSDLLQAAASAAAGGDVATARSNIEEARGLLDSPH